MVRVIPHRAVVAARLAPQSGQRRRLTPDELHAQRVAWGKKWGALVSNEVARQLREAG